MDKSKIEEARTALRDVVYRFKAGGLTYDTAKVLATPHIAVLNAVGKEIAKKHKRNFNPLNWSGIIR